MALGGLTVWHAWCWPQKIKMSLTGDHWEENHCDVQEWCRHDAMVAGWCLLLVRHSLLSTIMCTKSFLMHRTSLLFVPLPQSDEHYGKIRDKQCIRQNQIHFQRRWDENNWIILDSRVRWTILPDSLCRCCSSAPILADPSGRISHRLWPDPSSSNGRPFLEHPHHIQQSTANESYYYLSF